MPLALWLLVPGDVFDMALQDYGRPEFGWKSLVSFLVLVLAFYIGYRASIFRQVNGAPRGLDADEIRFVRVLHILCLVLSAISVLVVIRYCLVSGVSIWETILAAQANEFREIVYSTGVVPQAFMMARHLVITSLATWFILYHYKVAPRTLLLILAMGGVLFLLTSSRLTVMAMVLLAMLAYTQRPERTKRSMVKLIIFAGALVVVFGVGVFARSVETWAAVTGSTNPLVIVSMELLAYVISPVNYSVALIEYAQYYYPSNALASVFSFVYSVFNLEGGIDTSYLENISYFYNPSLNQIGLVGKLFTGYGPFLFIPVVVFGFVSGRAYRSFSRGRLLGVLLYPLVYISIFDSFRGFLLTQNVIISNILFASFLVTLYRLRIWPGRHEASCS
jgi:hypothetical protein